MKGAKILIESLIKAGKPDVVYTHNLADKHQSHVAVALKTIQALRKIPKDFLPKKIYGCEVWRSLDWLIDKDKIMLDVSLNPNLANSLLGVFNSQISGGKRYDNATKGRRIANATFAESHKTDEATEVILAFDLTPLINDINLNISDYILNSINNFKEDILANIKLLQ